jgi:predicted RND superfamily exporter protein
VSIHERIEAGFEAWGYLVCRHRWATVVAVLLVTALLLGQLPKLQAEFSTESYLRGNDPARVTYDAFREQFGRDDRILVGLAPPDVFDLAFLERLRGFHRALERELPYVEEVTSLVNARWTRGDGDELIVEDLMEEWPAGADDLDALEARALGNPLYVNTLLSEGASFTTVTIKPFTYSTRGAAEDDLAGFEDADPADVADESKAMYLTRPEHEELVVALDAVVEEHWGPDFPLHVLGSPLIDSRFSDLAERDISKFVPAALLAISILLYALFRRLTSVILPLAVILTSLGATFGCIAWLGVPFGISMQMVPNFLIAVGVCDSVHILAILYRRLAGGSGKEDAIAFALRHSGLAVVMTSLTTAGGLASFLAAEIAPVRHLGIASPIGVLLALAYTLTLLPALLAIVPLAPARGARGRAVPVALDRFLSHVGDLATAHPRRVLVGTLAVVLLAGVGVSRVRFSHDIMSLLREDQPLRAAVERVDGELGGASTVEVLIDSGRENGLYEPETLNRIERAMRWAESLDTAPFEVAKAISIVDLVKEIHRALNENEPSRDALPQDRHLIAQELLLFENSGSDDLGDFTDSQLRVARMTLRVPWADAVYYLPFLNQVQDGLRDILGEELRFRTTGTVMLVARTFTNLIVSLARSYVLALLIITPLMILLIGNLKRGLVSMVPNLIPVFLTLGLMGWLDIPLSFSTLLVGSIVIGLAVDDTIHFMHKFNRYYQATGDPRAAVHETLTTTGSAMLATSLVLGSCFAMFMLGEMLGTVQFGILTVFAAVVAFLADVLVAPALMMLVVRKE